MKVFLPVAGFFAFLAILFSGLGAHFFEKNLSPEQLHVYLLAIKFQLIHSLALFVIGLFGFVTRKPFLLLLLAGYLFVFGIIFFCGDIYLTLIFSDTANIQAMMPVGGIALMLGWLVVFCAGIYYYFHAVHAHDL